MSLEGSAGVRDLEFPTATERSTSPSSRHVHLLMHPIYYALRYRVFANRRRVGSFREETESLFRYVHVRRRSIAAITSFAPDVVFRI